MGSSADRMTRMGGMPSAVHSTPMSRPPLTTQCTAPASRTTMTTEGLKPSEMNRSWLSPATWIVMAAANEASTRAAELKQPLDHARA